jgi:alanine racemase
MRAVVCEVNLDAISRNIIEIKKKIGINRKILVPVKANAYGHGAVGTSKALEKMPVDILGVSSIYEGKELVNAGITLPVMILGLVIPQESPEVVKYGITTTIMDTNLPNAISKEAVKQGKKAKVHLKVDTGMGRIGAKPKDALKIAQEVLKMPNIELEGLFTHMPVADEVDKSFSYHQLNLFKKVLCEFENEGISIPIKHMANSGGVLDLPETYFDMVRPGILTYGYYPSDSTTDSVKVEPCMSLKTHITAIKRVPAGTSLSYGRTYFTDKETNIITLPIGYADGLNIKLSGVLKVGIRDKKYTISGRISMDQTMVDIGDDSYPVGEEVVIYDREENTISNIAKLLNTIPYEVMCWISARVERRYIKKDLMKNNLEKYYMTSKSKSI